jgi:hypothetical protein
MAIRHHIEAMISQLEAEGEELDLSGYGGELAKHLERFENDNKAFLLDLLMETRILQLFRLHLTNIGPYRRARYQFDGEALRLTARPEISVPFPHTINTINIRKSLGD